MWFFSIQGTKKRSVKKSESVYATAKEALAAGNEYLQENRVSIQRAADPHEVFSLTTGQAEK